MIKFKTKSGQWEITNPTIGQYYKMQDWLILSDKTDVQVKLVSILSGAPEEDLRSMDTDSFIKIWNQTALGPLNSLADKSFQKEIEIDDTKYGFITMSKLTVGELADMDVLKNHEQVSKQLHKMMAIMYRPLNADGTVSEYTSDNFDERAELFLNKMPISYVTTAIDFFFHITRVCLNNMLDSLIPMMTGMMQDLTESQQEDVISKLQETGINLSTFLPEMTSSEQTVVQN